MNNISASMPMALYNEDCLEVLKGLENNSIGAIVTDPPYNLGVMGKQWDNTGIAFNIELDKGYYDIAIKRIE